jgi:hypothetical protein
MGVDNVVDLYRLACMYQDEKISRKAKEFMLDTENFRLVSNKPEFLTLEKDLQQSIYMALLIKEGGFQEQPSMRKFIYSSNKEKVPPLLFASSKLGMSVCVQFLIENGAKYALYKTQTQTTDANIWISAMQVDANGNTPLHLACFAGDILTVGFLCKYPSVNLSAKNKQVMYVLKKPYG